jgi:sigma-B regulation protein RsbU (phosphoserine phosphatase)
VTLQKGDTILMYSDGVTDANDTRDQQFSQKAVTATVAGLTSSSPRGMIERLLKAVEQHSSGAKQNDDITMVALGRLA